MGLLTKLRRWTAGIIARMTTDRVVHVGKVSTTILDPELADRPETGARVVARAAGYAPPIKRTPGFDVATFRGDPRRACDPHQGE